MQTLLQQKGTDMSLDEITTKYQHILNAMLTQDMESVEQVIFWELG